MQRFFLFSIVLLFLFTGVFSQVKIQETTINLPAHSYGEADKSPLFLAANGSRVYPYPHFGKVAHQQLERIYKALKIENEFIEVCVLPQLGGRIYYALDKTTGKDFIYRNNIVQPITEPTGLWLPGGVTWNIAQTGNVTSLLPVEFRLEEQADGAKTIWTGAYEKQSQVRWMTGLTLYPGKAFVEVTVKCLNVTPVMNRVMFNINTTAPANEKFQVNLWNCPAGTAYSSPQENSFVTGVDPEIKTGVALVGNHPIFSVSGLPGSGQPQLHQGKNGPYVELHAALFSGNGKSYSWQNPYEMKDKAMYLFPFKNMASVKEANKYGAVNLEIKGGKALVEIHSTSKFPKSRMALYNNGKEVIAREINLDPVVPFTVEVKIPSDADPGNFTLMVVSPDNQVLHSYTPSVKKEKGESLIEKIPEEPSKMIQADQLYRNGLSVEQMVNTPFNAELYYLEALKHDSGHILANTQMGILNLKPGFYGKSQAYLERAVKGLSMNGASPRYGEPLYHLGVSLFLQNKLQEAYSMFSKAATTQEWASPSYYLLAVIDCLNADYNAAIEKLSESLASNANNVDAINLMAVILRRNGENDLAKQAIAEADRIDPLNPTAAFEKYLLDKKTTGMKAPLLLREFYHDEADNYLETASRYMLAGFYSDAIELLWFASAPEQPSTSKNPLVQYYLGYCYSKSNQLADATKLYEKASAMEVGLGSPYGTLSYAVLADALKVNDKDATAHYLMGNLLCNSSPAEAFRHWEIAAMGKNRNLAFRNQAFVLANFFDKPREAVIKLDSALNIPEASPVFLLERDNYAAYGGENPIQRLAFMEKYKKLASSLGETELRLAELYALAGNYDACFEILKNTQTASINSKVLLAKVVLARGIRFLKSKEPDKAITDFDQVLTIQDNSTNIGRPANFWLAMAYKQKGDSKKSRGYFNLVTAPVGSDSSTTALELYSQALAWIEMGNRPQAEKIFHSMVSQGNNILNQKYHEALNNNSLQAREARKYQKANGYFYIGLGNKGLGDHAEASANFKRALETDPGFFELTLVD